MTPAELIKEAQKKVGSFQLSEDCFTAGSVAAALISKAGNIYTGICIDVSSGIGFCAEHSAIAEMLKNRETEIEMIVAVNSNKILPPCGRCREFMLLINNTNLKTKVIVADNKIETLGSLLPFRVE
jgi:cytidine deaminase